MVRMRRRLLTILSIALLVGAVAVPARAAIGPVTVVQVGCDFEAVTADAVATSGGLTRGFVSFHGGSCADLGLIFYFQGSGGSWTRAQSPLRGRVLAAAGDGSSTFLLYQGTNGIWIAKRPHTGGLVNVQRGSTATQGGGALGAGDCIDPIVKQQITFTGNDERPSIVLKPASAGASGADLFFSRNDGAQGTRGHIRTGSADCTGNWAFRRLSFAGDIDLNPDAFRSGPGNNHLTFQRDGNDVVYLNNASGGYRGRQFVTPGVEPRVATSLGVVFVAYKDFRQHPFVAIYRGGAWSGRDLTPGAGDQQVLAVTATGGRGTVLAASQASDRLYAVADL